jgi:oxygen-independent coproporphyrinogen-3 oxidase
VFAVQILDSDRVRPTIPVAARSGDSAMSVRPLLIYVNVPFCNSKCHFCDWVVQVPVNELRLSAQSSPRVRYLEAVREQIRAQAPALVEDGYRARIMYWGGGTASILSGQEIGLIHETLAGEFDLDGLAEATIEGSPESLDPAKLRLLRSLGFNRISIGVQSFDDHRLRTLGRAHSATQAVQGVEEARSAGFENINIDLIVGFPDQSLDEVERSVRTAVSLPVNHFSVYPYRASPGTILRKQLNRKDSRIDREAQQRAYALAAELLEGHGFAEYAMSYFGAPRCQSDEAYYQLTMDWIGFGSGANSLINQRFLSNKRGFLHEYNNRPTTFDVDVPAMSDAALVHFLSQALTTAEGMDAAMWEERTGCSLEQAYQRPMVSSYLQRMSGHGRLLRDERGIRLHREDIAQAFVALNWIEMPAPRPEVAR